jgi:hypothetical protein
LSLFQITSIGNCVLIESRVVITSIRKLRVDEITYTTVDSQVKVKVTLRLTISRPVRLGIRSPSGTHDQFFYLLEIFF